MTDNAGKTSTAQDYLNSSLLGSKEIASMNIGSLKDGMLKVVRATELKKRGLRFLPSQVVKRALRKKLHSLRVADPPESVFVIPKRQG